jgi:hypothetical protein
VVDNPELESNKKQEALKPSAFYLQSCDGQIYRLLNSQDQKGRLKICGIIALKPLKGGDTHQFVSGNASA